MSRLFSKRLVVLMVAACVALAAPPARAQFAVVTVKSIDDVLDAAKILAEKAGEGDKAKQLGLAKLFLNGIDTTKPLGVYIGVPTGEGIPPVVAFIPVSKEEDLLDQLKQLQVDVGKPEKEVRTVAGPNGQNAYLRFANGHAYVSDKADILEGKLPEPGKFLPADSKTHLVAAGVRLSQLPKQMRQAAIGEVKKRVEKEKERKDGESDAAYEGRLVGIRLSTEFVDACIVGAEDISLGLKIDGKADKLVVDLSMSAAADSALASHAKKLENLTSKFAPLAADSAFNLLCDLPVSDKVRKSVGKVIEKGVREALDKEPDADKKKLGEQIFHSVRDCFATESFDLGVFLMGPYDDKLVAFVAGYQIKDGKKLDELLRSVLGEAKDDVKLDVEKVGDVAIHRIVPKDKMDEKTMKTFGNNEVFFCVRNDALLLSLGKHGLPALKHALGRLDKATSTKNTNALQMEFSFLKIAGMDNGFKAGEAEAIRKALAGAAKGSDRVRISILGGDALRLRLDMSLEMVKAAVALGKLKQGAE